MAGLFIQGVLLHQSVRGHIWHCLVAFTEPCIPGLSPSISRVWNLTILHTTSFSRITQLKMLHGISAASKIIATL